MNKKKFQLTTVRGSGIKKLCVVYGARERDKWHQRAKKRRISNGEREKEEREFKNFFSLIFCC